MKKNTFNFISLGCSRNLVDSEIMIGILLNNGFKNTDKLEEANFLIVNTCCFVKEARDEVYEVLDEVFALKNKKAKVIVCGCMNPIFTEELESLYPDIFYFLGSGNAQDIMLAMSALKKGRYITKKSCIEKKQKAKRFLSTASNYAYLKISEGCLKKCSYCLIPKIKGPLKSKPLEKIVEEFKNLLSKGVYEVILIGQNLTDYGKDLKQKASLEILLKEILKIKKDFWIRLLYVYPEEITDELIAIMKSDKRICKYIDMPIQHISDKILKKMKRLSTKECIIKVIDKLRKEIKDIVIRTTVMVGFPSETEADFVELVEFIKTKKPDLLGIFKFSKEENVGASTMEDQIPEKTKQKRATILQKLQAKIVKEKNKSLTGKTLEAFIEKKHPDSDFLLQARYWGQTPDVDPIIIINDQAKVDSLNDKYLVEITGAVGYDLIGTVVKKI